MRNTKKNSPAHKKAFTLIEILFVIVIIGILATVVVITLAQSAKERARIAKGQQFNNSLRARLSDSPIAWWRFENNTNDTWGSHTISSVTGTIQYDNDGVSGSAWTLDGNDSIYITSTPDINQGSHQNRTVSVWFKTGADIITKQAIYSEGGGARGLVIYINNDSLYVGGWNIPEYSWNGTWLNTLVTAGKWHNAVLVLENGDESVQPDKLRGYFNGNEFDKGSGGQLNNHASAVIGGEGSAIFHDGLGDSNYFTGLIDEVQIYNEAFPTAQIQQYYTESAPRYGIALK